MVTLVVCMLAVPVFSKVWSLDHQLQLLVGNLSEMQILWAYPRSIRNFRGGAHNLCLTEPWKWSPCTTFANPWIKTNEPKTVFQGKGGIHDRGACRKDSRHLCASLSLCQDVFNVLTSSEGAQIILAQPSPWPAWFPWFCHYFRWVIAPNVLGDTTTSSSLGQSQG